MTWEELKASVREVQRYNALREPDPDTNELPPEKQLLASLGGEMCHVITYTGDEPPRFLVTVDGATDWHDYSEFDQ